MSTVFEITDLMNFSGHILNIFRININLKMNKKLEGNRNKLELFLCKI